MAYFGTDGNNDAAGINPPATPEGVLGIQYVAQNTVRLIGGQVSEAGTPTHVSVYAASYDGVTASNHYFAVYKGGAANNPTGATLIGITANITANYGTTPGWITFALTGTASFSASDYLWIGFLGRGSNSIYGIRPREIESTTYLENLTNKGAGTYDYTWEVTDGTSGGLSSTLPSGGAWVGALPSAAYITYTTGGSSVAPIASYYRMLGNS